MRLSKNFTLDELTKTSTGEVNKPTDRQIEKLFYLATYLLQPIRDHVDLPVRVNSGFRSLEVNRAVGGSPSSQHMDGEAGDLGGIHAMRLRLLFAWITKESGLKFGQCILYVDNGVCSFIHISLPRVGKENQEALICREGLYERQTKTEVK